MGGPWESDRPLTHSGPVAPLPAKAMHLAEDRTASPAVRERPIGLSRPLTHSGPVAPLPAKAMHLAEDRTASPAVRERPIGLSRPPIRPLNSASHFGLSDRSHDLGLSHTPIGLYRAMQSDPRGRLTDFTAKRIASPGVCERLIGCAPLIGSDRSHEKFCEAKTMRGRISDSQMCEADLRGRFVRPCEAVWGRAPLIGSHRSRTLWHRSLSQWEEHGLTRPHTASQIGLSDRPHTSGSPKFPQNLTFDSNSTSDRKFYQMC